MAPRGRSKKVKKWVLFLFLIVLSFRVFDRNAFDKMLQRGNTRMDAALDAMGPKGMGFPNNTIRQTVKELLKVGTNFVLIHIHIYIYIYVCMYVYIVCTFIFLVLGFRSFEILKVFGFRFTAETRGGPLLKKIVIVSYLMLLWRSRVVLQIR